MLHALEASKENLNQQLRYNDAIEKMISRFELKIVENINTIPIGYKGAQSYINIIKKSILNLTTSTTEVNQLQQWLQDYPIEGDNTLSIAISPSISKKHRKDNLKTINDIMEFHEFENIAETAALFRFEDFLLTDDELLFKINSEEQRILIEIYTALLNE